MRKKWAKTSAKVALLTAGFVVIGSGAGYAGEVTHGDFGAGSGNQLHVPASAPINLSGNAGSVLGQARALSDSGASVHNHGSGNMLSSGRFAFIGGNQGYAPISVPVNGSGNAGTAGGQAWAASKSAATVVNGHGHAGDSGSPASTLNRATRPVTDTARKAMPQAAPASPLSGATQSLPSPLSSITDAAKLVPGGGLPSTGALPKLPLKKKQHMAASSDSDGGTMLSSGDFGVLSGNQAYVPVSAPVNFCGNSAAVLGQAFAACKGAATVHNSGGNQLTSGKFGVLGGNQLNAPISAPFNICGNAISGAGQALAKCKGRATVDNGHTHRVWTPKPTKPQAPAPMPAPQQGPPEQPRPAKPAPKPNLPKPKLPKLPIGVEKPAPSCACAPAPAVKTPQVPSVALPKPQAPTVTPPKVEKPQVKLPKAELPKADVPLPLPQQVSDCGCVPQAPKASVPESPGTGAGTRVTAGDDNAIRNEVRSVGDSVTGGDDNSITNHLSKKRDGNSVATPTDEASRQISRVLHGQNSPVSLGGTVVK